MDKDKLCAETRQAIVCGAVRSSANAIQVWFKDGSKTPKVEVEFPPGHQRRRAEAQPIFRAKFESSLARRFSPQQCEQILELCDDPSALDQTPVNEFLDMFCITDAVVATDLKPMTKKYGWADRI